MKAIICGAGQVGSGIARQLVAEGNDVTIIDWRPELVRSIQEMLDLRGIIGHGAHPDVLDQAGASDCDLLIAVTYSDEVNMVAAQIGHSLFSVPLKIARVRAQSYLKPMWQNLFTRDHMPIDVIISPEVEVGRSVLRRLEVPGAFESIDFANGLVQLVGARIGAGAPVANSQLKQIRELFPELTTVVVGIARGETLFVPSGSDQLLAGDEAYFVASRGHVSRTLEIFGHEEKEARRVVVLGGGNIGQFIARELEKATTRVKVRLVEVEKARAEEAAEALARTVVLHGSGLDQAILREAGVPETEAFLAVTNDDKVNILSSLMAKNLGCQRVVTLLNNPDYNALVSTLGIDAYLDPRATTVSTILQHIRRGRIKRLHSIRGGEGEVIEGEALKTSPLVGRPLKEVELPSGVVIGAVVRDQKAMMLAPEMSIEAGDHVVMFAEREMVRRVEQFFRVGLEYF
ncbi:MAG: Trk system potassium transporter TrkA [Alphaproteobacteria bacterium]|nr:Trk system potassium transporter TrkA [Alphaproteobacteria bacterium]